MVATNLHRPAYIFVVFLSFVSSSESLSRPSTMVFENNQYKNVVIALHDSIAMDNSLIDKLKTVRQNTENSILFQVTPYDPLDDTMTKASKYLYTATRHRAYFKEITILLPSSWTPDASYSAPTNETINMADVVISNPSRSTRSLPQARSYAGCGKQGVHVFLTQDFLTNIPAEPFLNDPAKFFIHAFAQFRWGVFQEYAEEGETEFYLSLTSGLPEAIRCVRAIRGLIAKFDAHNTICYRNVIDRNTGLFPPDCKWRPYPTRQRAKASIMDHQSIQSIETFCDDDMTPAGYVTLHNYEAPSKHNRLCGHHSTWSIITATDDFKNNANLPVNLTDADLVPTFKVMRTPTRKRRAVIAIDTSVVNDNELLYETHRRIGYALHELLHDHDVTSDANYHIGVIHYGAASSASIPVRRIRSTDDVNVVTKELLKTSKPRRNVKFEEALEHAIKDVQRNDPTQKVGDLVIVTNTSGLLDHTYRGIGEYAQAMGLNVHAIYLNHNGNSTSQTHIDGVSVYHEGPSLGSSVTDHLRHIILADGVSDINKPVILKHLHLTAVEPAHSVGYVDIDQSVGRNTVFTWQYRTSVSDVTLTSPTGQVYRTSSVNTSVDTDLRTVKFAFPLAEPGSWKYDVEVTPGNDVGLCVTSLHRTDTNEDPIVIKTEISTDSLHTTLFADVTIGIHPVIGLTVSATVTSPGDSVNEVVLLDNGAGADISRNDGVYSRHFTRLEGAGLYHVTLTVTGRHGEIFVKEDDVVFPTDAEARVKKTTTNVPLPGNLSRHVYAGTFGYNPREHESPEPRVTERRTTKYTDIMHKNIDERMKLEGIEKSIANYDNIDDRVSSTDRETNTNNSDNFDDRIHSADIETPDTDIGDGVFTKSRSKTETVPDDFAPCRVHDLVVDGLLPYRHTVVLSWTAPGDDLDAGQVDHYELFIGKDIKDVRDIIKFSETGTHDGHGRVTMETHHVAFSAGNREVLLWQPDPLARTNVYAFAVRGVDEVGQRAEVSNVVTSSLKFS